MARCNTCGLFGCVHSRTKEAEAKAKSMARAYTQNKKETLKAFYAEISRAQARTPGDWYRCSCGSTVHAAYKDAHIKSKHFYGCEPAVFTKIDSEAVLNGVDNGDGILTVEESLSKLTKACEGCTGDEACCALVGLKAAGWDVEINPAMAYGDRKGYQITILEPKKG